MKLTIKFLDSISTMRQDEKFKMFITHIGEHIDKSCEICLDKEFFLNSWINTIQTEVEMTSDLAHKIAAWINENTSRRAA